MYVIVKWFLCNVPKSVNKAFQPSEATNNDWRIFIIRVLAHYWHDTPLNNFHIIFTPPPRPPRARLMCGASGLGSLSQTPQLSLRSSALCNRLAQNWTFILCAHKLSSHRTQFNQRPRVIVGFVSWPLLFILSLYSDRFFWRVALGNSHWRPLKNAWCMFLLLCFMFGSSLPASVCRFDHLSVSPGSFFFSFFFITCHSGIFF